MYPLGLPVGDNLPVTDIVATFTPMIAASILVYREENLSGVKDLLKRTFDYKRITKKAWYVPIILLMPFIYVLTYVIMRLSGYQSQPFGTRPFLHRSSLLCTFLPLQVKSRLYGICHRSYASPVHRTGSQPHHWVDPCGVAFPVGDFNRSDPRIVYMGRSYTGR